MKPVNSEQTAAREPAADDGPMPGLPADTAASDVPEAARRAAAGATAAWLTISGPA
jgi:hypothetical protein